jgi:hypothetical protein
MGLVAELSAVAVADPSKMPVLPSAISNDACALDRFPVFVF